MKDKDFLAVGLFGVPSIAGVDWHGILRFMLHGHGLCDTKKYVGLTHASIIKAGVGYQGAGNQAAGIPEIR